MTPGSASAQPQGSQASGSQAVPHQRQRTINPEDKKQLGSPQQIVIPKDYIQRTQGMGGIKKPPSLIIQPQRSFTPKAAVIESRSITTQAQASHQTNPAAASQKMSSSQVQVPQNQDKRQNYHIQNKSYSGNSVVKVNPIDLTSQKYLESSTGVPSQRVPNQQKIQQQQQA